MKIAKLTLNNVGACVILIKTAFLISICEKCWITEYQTRIKM